MGENKMNRKLWKSTWMRYLLVLLMGSGLLVAGSQRPDPLALFSDRAIKQKKYKIKKSRNKPHRVRYIASGRSLSSYGRMGGEYLGLVKNSTATKTETDISVYTHHTLTDKPYLSLKAIDGPLPQDYAALFFKSKTLLDPLKPSLKIIVDKSQQRIFVYRDLEHLFTFKSSTARRGYYTVTGTFSPLSLERMHYSRKYHNSPMPWSVFFHGGFAIHGTESIRRLGTPASHGCVRTHPVSAKRIFGLIKKYGRKNTKIIVRN